MLRQLALSPAFRLVITGQAARQMRDRDIANFEVERVLKTGAVVMLELDPDGTERWRVAGHDAAGGRIEPVVALNPPHVILVTVIRVS